MAFQQALHRPGGSEAASHQPVIRAVPNSVRNSREATTIQRFKKYRTAEETALYAGEPSTPRARAGIMRTLAGSYQLSFAGSTQYATRFSVLVSTMEDDMAPGYRSPDLLRYSQTVIGWLTDPAPHALAAQVAGWDDDAWETARWAIQVHGIGPLLHA